MSLCSRCGSSEWEELSETETRCAECGHGARRSRLVATSDATRPVDWAAVDARHAARVTSARRAFERAPFSCHALDDHWRGLRWFGGHGTSNGAVSHLATAHGDEPWNEQATHVRVDTTPDRGYTRFEVVRHLVNAWWHQTGTLPDPVRRAAFPVDESAGDPTAPWDDLTLAVDGRPTAFRALGSDEYWVAIASVGAFVLSVEARSWPSSETGLVTITDLEPYERGAIEVHRRRRRDG